MKDDVISRQAAIDAFKPYADYESNRTNADWVRRIELVLHDLPSAQPEKTQLSREDATSDCISRQSAINIVYFECGEWEGLAKTIVKDINDLPSVQPEPSQVARDIATIIENEQDMRVILSHQPEVIRCKDCKHFEYDHPYVIRGVPVLGHEVCNAWGDGCKTDENGYCFLAERRTDDDRNG